MNRKNMVMITVCCMAMQVSLGDVWQDLATYKYGDEKNTAAEAEELLQNTPVDQHGAIEGKLIAVVAAKNATADGKAHACRMLQQIATEKSIPALAGLLTDDILSHYARLALERIGSAKADKAMRDALDKAPDKVKVGIIGSLGERRDNMAIKQASKLAQHKDTAIAKAAIFALGRIGGEEAANVLLRVKTPDNLRRVLKDACLLCADSLVAEGKTSEARKVYKEMFAEGNPMEIRVAALQGIVKVDKEKAVPMIVQLLKSDNKVLQAAAGAAVVDMPGNAATTAFAKELPALSPNAQIVMLGSLAAMKDTQGASGVANNLAKSEEEPVRIAALRALARLGDVSSIPVLAGASVRGGNVGSAALDSLSKISGTGIDSALINLAQSGSQVVRAKMLGVLAARKCRAALPVLFKLVNDEDETIRTASLKALGSTAVLDDVPKLIGILVKTRDASIRQGIERALASITSRAADQERSTKTVVAGLSRAGNDAKCTLLAVLGSIGAKDALGVVSKELTNKDAEVRKAAIKALGGWKNASPMNRLLMASKKDSDSTNRILAFRGFINMVSLPSSRSNAETVKILDNAIRFAGRNEEKKLVLGALSSFPSPGALKVAKRYLKDKALKTEAMTAYVNIADSIKGDYKAEAKAALKYVLEVATDGGVRKRAEDALYELAASADIITAWQTSGPYMGGNVFDTAFDPEKPGARNVKWKIAPVSPQGVVDLKKICGGNNRAAYLRCVVVSPEKQDVRLEVGSDDGVKVWLNKKVIHSNNVKRGLKPWQDKINITLNKGDNSLLMKITQGGGGWEACARITRRDNDALGNLGFKPE